MDPQIPTSSYIAYLYLRIAQTCFSVCQEKPKESEDIQTLLMIH